LIEQLLEYLIDFQAFDVQLRGNSHAVTQNGQRAAFDVIWNHKFAAAQQGPGAGATYQGD